MKILTVPESITFNAPDGTKAPPYAFGFFVHQQILSDVRFRDEWAAAFPRLVALLPLNMEAGEVVTLEDDDQEKCKKIVKDLRINPELSVQMMPFIHAFTLAEHKQEEKKSKEQKALKAAAS